MVTGLVEIPRLLVLWKCHMSSRGNATCREMPRVFVWKSHGLSRGKEAFHGKFWHFPCEAHMVPRVDTRVKVKLQLSGTIYLSTPSIHGLPSILNQG